MEVAAVARVVLLAVVVCVLLSVITFLQYSWNYALFFLVKRTCPWHIIVNDIHALILHSFVSYIGKV